MRAWMLLSLLNSMHTVGFKLRKCWARLYQLCHLLFTRCESASLYQTTNSSPGEIFIAGKRHLAHCSCVLWAVPEAGVRQEWSVTLDSHRGHHLGIRTMLVLGRLLWRKAGAGRAFLKLLSIVISKGSLQQPASCLVFVKDIPPFSSDRVHLFCCLFLSSSVKCVCLLFLPHDFAALAPLTLSSLREVLQNLSASAHCFGFPPACVLWGK